MRLMDLLKRDDIPFLSSDSKPDWIAGNITPKNVLHFIPYENIQVLNNLKFYIF